MMGLIYSKDVKIQEIVTESYKALFLDASLTIREQTLNLI